MAPRSYRFGEFELDLGTRQLRLAGEPIHLERQPLALLTRLVERSGQLLTRDEIAALLWGSDVVVDFEAGINTAIRKLRRALGDSSATPRFVEAVPRLGYRFVAQVTRDVGRSAGSVPNSLADLPTQSVGRTREAELLLASWRDARAGARSFAFVSGEPGIGKTQLAARLALAAAEDGATVLYGRADEDHAEPFQPWVRALRQIFAVAPLGALRAALGPKSVCLGRVLPEFGAAGGFPPRDPLAAETERARFFDAVDGLLAEAARVAPLLLVLDDLHWADSDSLLLLRHVARSSLAAAVMIVGTHRESEIAPPHRLRDVLADLRREPRGTRVALHGLDEGEVGALIAAVVGAVAPDSFVASVLKYTAGNPFFVVELLRHLREVGALDRHGERWARPPQVDGTGVPPGVREVVDRRLERLSPRANEALETASVRGPDFDFALLAELSAAPRAELLSALDEAVSAQLIVATREDATAFSFVHALVRQTLYEKLSSAQRARSHWAIADALEKRAGAASAEGAGAIARHRAAGVTLGDPLLAAAACVRAAERAGEIGAYEQAGSHAERALELLGGGAEQPELRYRAQMALAHARFMLAQPGHAAAFRAAESIARVQGWNQRAAAAVLASTEIVEFAYGHDAAELPRIEAALLDVAAEPSRERALLLGRLLHGIVLVKGSAGVDTIGNEAMALARATNDPQVNLEVLHAVAFSRLGRPDCAAILREGAALAPLAVGAAQRHRALRMVVTDAVVRGDRTGADAELEAFRRADGAFAPAPFGTELLRADSSIALADGRFADVKRIVDEILPVERELPSTRLLTRRLRRVLRYEENPLEEVAEDLLSELEGESPTCPAFRSAGAALRGELGRAQQARALLDDLLPNNFASLPRDWSWQLSLRYLAEAVALVSHREAAAALDPLLLPWSGSLLWAFGIQLPQCAADRALGQVYAAVGRRREADACYARALALEEGFGARALAARTRLWWARLLADGARPADDERALQLTRACLAFAREAGMHQLARDAQALARQITRGAP